MIKRLTATFIAICMLLALAIPALSEGYSDTENSWASDAIDRWTRSGIVNGDGRGLFLPNDPMTRAEAAAVFTRLFRLEVEAELDAFTDTSPDSWYYSYIAKCVAAGIMKGTSATTISPNEKLSREMYFVMLVRALGLEEGGSEPAGFADYGSVSPWAAGAVKALSERGFLDGTFNGLLEPDVSINRASVMSLLDKTISVYANEEGASYETERAGIVLVVADNTSVKAPAGSAVVIEGEAEAVSLKGSSGEIEIIVCSSGAALENVPAGASVAVSSSAENVTINGKAAPAGETTELLEEKPAEPYAPYIPPAVEDNGGDNGGEREKDKTPTSVTVTITGHSAEAAYDGKEHTVSGYDVSADNELYTEEDFSFTGEASVSGTEAGAYEMGLRPEDFKNINESFASVTFAVTDGKLVIKAADPGNDDHNDDHNDDDNDEPTGKKLVRSDLEEAIVELAWDYFAKGAKLQYGSQELSVFDKYYGGQYRLTEDAAPEYGTSDTTIYSVCSDYVYKVYYEALGYRMFDSNNYLDAVTTAMWLFCEDYDTLLIRWKNEGYALTEADKTYGGEDWSFASTDEVRSFLEDYENNLRPGDVLLPTGHAMLYIGGGYVLDCWGAKYDVGKGQENFEENGGVSVLHRLSEVFLTGDDPVTKTSYQLSAGVRPKTFAAFRPLNILTEKESGETAAEDTAGEDVAITETAEIRMAYPAMEIDRTVSITPYGTARTGEELSYSIKITNRTDMEAYKRFISDVSGEAYTGEAYKAFSVTEAIPEGTELVAGSISNGGAEKDGAITWDIKALAPGETLELSYTVRVTAESGAIVSTGGSVAGIPSNTITSYIGGARLSEEHSAGLLAFAETESDSWLERYNISTATSDLDFAERVYAKAMGIELELPTMEELVNNILELKTVTISALSRRYSGEKTQRVFMLRDEVEPKYSDIRNMLFNGYWGGWYIYFEGQGKTMNEFSIRYLEPGDIIAYADVDSTDPSRLTSTRVMVYCGDGRMVYIGSDKTAGSTTQGGTEALIWYAFNPDVFFLLRPSLAFEDINDEEYDITKEPTYDDESGEKLGEISLSEENATKLAALEESGWQKKNLEFAVEVYGAIGLDITEKLTKSVGGIYTGVDIFKNLFTDDTTTGKAHFYTQKARGDLADSGDLNIYNMFLKDYAGGPQMNAAGAAETHTIDRLEPGDILVLAQRSKSIYWAGVALGGGRLLMSEYYKNAYADNNIAAGAQIYAVLDYSSDNSGYPELLKRDPVTGEEWEAYYALRPYGAYNDINEEAAVSSEEPEEPETHAPLSEANKAKLLEVAAGEEWNKNNSTSDNNHANFAINVYRLAGLDIEGEFYKTNNNTSCVYMTNALFNSQSASPYNYTLKAENEVAADYKPLYKMHLSQYRGGTDMAEDGAFSAPKLSDLEAGDIIVLVNRTGAYWVGVYVGESRIAMSKYYTSGGAAYFSKTNGTTYELYELTEEGFAALLSGNPDASDCSWQNYMVLRPYLAYEDINEKTIPAVTAEIPLNDAAREALSRLTAEGWSTSNTAFALEVYKKIGLDLTDKFGTSNPSAVTLLKNLFSGATSTPYAYALLESAPTESPYDQIYRMVLEDYMGGTYMTKKAENPTLEQLQVGDILLFTNRANGIYWVGVKINDGKLLVSEYYNKAISNTEITAARTTYKIYTAEEYSELLKADAYTKTEWEGYFALRPESAYKS